MAAAVIHADLDQRGVGDLFGLLAGHLAGDDKPLGHVLQGSLICEKVVALEHKARAAAQGVGLAMGDAVQLDAPVIKQHCALVGLLQKVQAAQHRCFSTSTGA